MLAVLIISSFIMIVPQNIYNTILDESFVTTMGMGICDAYLYIKPTQTDNVAQKAEEAAKALASDPDVAKVAVFTTKMFEMTADDGSAQKLRVSFGDHTAYPIGYSEGSAPQLETEIAISAMYAEELAKTIGDEIALMIDGAEKRLTVCGVYSDITNNGRTSKAVFETGSGDIIEIGIAAAYRAGADAAAVTGKFKEAFPFAKVYGIEEFIGQMFGPMVAAIKMASTAAIGAAVLLTVLITALFMKMLVAKDRYPIAILKSLGFTGEDIRGQYLTRSFIVTALGIVIGTVLANTLGAYVGMALISSIGASTFNPVINPVFAYLLSPLLIATAVYIATLLGVGDIRALKISEHIKEA
jgi:putative ABC transport system permease protein